MRMIYPECRTVGEAEVRQWAMDRRVDRALEEVGLGQANPFDDARVGALVAAVQPPTLAEAVEELEDDGVATFER